MLFKRIDPPVSLQPFIKYYWTIEDEDRNPVCQKIIPDGYPEIIIHYGDPYRILIKDEWELQNDFLLAGQFTRSFHLQNTGKTGVFGIKLQPTAPWLLFNLSMKGYTDKVIPIHEADPDFKSMRQIITGGKLYEETVCDLNLFFQKIVAKRHSMPNALDTAVNLLFERKGMVNTRELAAAAFFSERQLLNQFGKQVGLPPKLLSRIVRLNYIFQLVKENNEKWSSLAYEAAYFDQSHFIREFKWFTGENPSKYAFDEKNLANFFLRPAKKGEVS